MTEQLTFFGESAPIAKKDTPIREGKTLLRCQSCGRERWFSDRCTFWVYLGHGHIPLNERCEEKSVMVKHNIWGVWADTHHALCQRHAEST